MYFLTKITYTFQRNLFGQDDPVPPPHLRPPSIFLIGFRQFPWPGRTGVGGTCPHVHRCYATRGETVKQDGWIRLWTETVETGQLQSAKSTIFTARVAFANAEEYTVWAKKLHTKLSWSYMSNFNRSSELFYWIGKFSSKFCSKVVIMCSTAPCMLPHYRVKH